MLDIRDYLTIVLVPLCVSCVHPCSPKTVGSITSDGRMLPCFVTVTTYLLIKNIRLQ